MRDEYWNTLVDGPYRRPSHMGLLKRLRLRMLGLLFWWWPLAFIVVGAWMVLW